MKHGNNSTWAAGQAAGLPQSAGIEATAPARAASFIADLFVPIGQALTTGALLAGLVAFIVWRAAPEWGGVFDLWLGLGLGIAALAWLLILVDTRRLLWAIERVIGADLDSDGAQGKPEERLVIVNAPQGQKEATQREAAAEASGFAQFVAALPVRGTAARTWEPILTRPVYTEYRDALIKLGWAKWASVDRDGNPNEKKGWVLVLDPAEMLKRISG